MRDRKRRGGGGGGGGGVNSLHFSRFDVIKRRNKRKEEEKKRLRYGQNQTINPFFFINLGLKEPYLVYWWCLTILD